MNVNSPKSPFLCFWVIQTGYWRDFNWKVFFIKNIFIYKKYDRFRKTVETGVDLQLSLLLQLSSSKEGIHLLIVYFVPCIFVHIRNSLKECEEGCDKLHTINDWITTLLEVSTLLQIITPCDLKYQFCASLKISTPAIPHERKISQCDLMYRMYRGRVKLET